MSLNKFLMFWNIDFCILLIAPEYGLDIHTQISSALCAIHNFNHRHDLPDSEALPDDGPYLDNNDDTDNGPHPTNDVEGQNNVSTIQDKIAQEMWENYLNVLHEWDWTLQTQFHHVRTPSQNLKISNNTRCLLARHGSLNYECNQPLCKQFNVIHITRWYSK